MHLRYQILEKLKADLQPFIVTKNGRVSLMRARAIEQEDMPFFTIIHTGETSTPDGVILDEVTNQELARINRRLLVNVIIQFKGRSDPQREFDELAELVEQAIPPSHLGGLVIDIIPTASEMFIDPQTAQSLGSGRVVFEVSYRTFAGIPDRAA
ncbi:hypothetical protein CES85_1066 [Ochrobactrum quorumnocens]|uniref:DUF3168 domain-containing protein n=1 Tax=Ochrobactrum quorumnocens TaxID=271865 RepID=A0A248ULR5_9HYPH|nr:hypothetical protein [[Ochrobactrum] quorumnocens]ASV87614.1 hypothetical protein CES85_1066 [[Ochrobactrum] quorumnocens]